MAAFYRWLDEASEGELLARRDEAMQVQARLTNDDLRMELRRLVRLVEEALVARRFRA